MSLIANASTVATVAADALGVVPTPITCIVVMTFTVVFAVERLADVRLKFIRSRNETNSVRRS